MLSSCIEQCFIADMLEQLPLAGKVGKTLVGGIDLNKARMRHVVEALIARRPTASPPPLAARVRRFTKQSPPQYGARHAAYDLKKLRGKHIVRRIGRTRRYQTLPAGLRAMAALVLLRDKAIKPLLAAARPLRPTRGAHNPKPIDAHYRAIQLGMRGVFHAASPLDDRQFSCRASPLAPSCSPRHQTQRSRLTLHHPHPAAGYDAARAVCSSASNLAFGSLPAGSP